jgi:hypothetical protein
MEESMSGILFILGILLAIVRDNAWCVIPMWCIVVCIGIPIAAFIAAVLSKMLE